ncbi:molybdopterin-guanine dinucleotide biosynthesis protein MobA [Panacibacter ginsenosidivorans]|uniref:Probable molybdenum cofactor guanylyltransferase n=1 Tax=Panacibacter ginsenosidivorans TaxID=1813871 RepID=A0A5B8VF84_9BACT|nr:NTP transferase domain-containing protein [Panacibacter ginsenosidivorans]QEC69979.1 molybdopterin-guanine dinucleotide biosynthesis protein MobA [Panacibacter ginsenosidivorans]
MISKDHKKHSDIARPSLGNFGRNEFAIVGTTCDNVKALSAAVIKALSSKYKCAYIDADHKDKNATVQTQEAFIEFTDKISYKEFRYTKDADKFQYHQFFNEIDLILVNGNHNEASKQIIVIDKVKEASLLKRASQLSNVQLILLHDNADGIFDFIKEAVPNWQQLPILALREENNIVEFLEKQLGKSIPVLNGLVLAGGKSVRMGFDKTVIEWHGKDQRSYMADTLKEICDDVFISCRSEQRDEIKNYKTIPDTFTGLGPYGAILSAFRENPDAAWFVAASDLPLIDNETLVYLIQHRDNSKVATTFESPHDGFPEPLITIWEPKAYPILLSFLAQGYSCPRKVLRNNDVHIIKALHPEKLMNVNTEAELVEAKTLLGNKTALA